ncbi:MAG: hypothetical protein ACE37H_11545 [Phycisphaeraceae bacterium]
MQWEYGLLVVGILFIIAAMFSLGRKRKHHADAQTTARDHVERARQKQGVRDELEALMVDINRMAKDLGAQLDAKILRIEKATRDADERIAQLQALRDTFDPATHRVAPDRTSSDDNPPAYENLVTPQRPPDQADPLTREVYALADQGIGPADIAEQLGEHVGKVELILALRSG